MFRSCETKVMTRPETDLRPPLCRHVQGRPYPHERRNPDRHEVPRSMHQTFGCSPKLGLVSWPQTAPHLENGSPSTEGLPEGTARIPASSPSQFIAQAKGSRDHCRKARSLPHRHTPPSPTRWRIVFRQWCFRCFRQRCARCSGLKMLAGSMAPAKAERMLFAMSIAI